ncbi:hypothetical protein BO70DRAFT_364706 [Aspergillus heteromorphus CBS 117.55]|uniref:SH3 domain signaling protein n=1 Tax=Aspergillus heteromorphus CBS 117.55 TaxID=1448321 RepID=A0A317VEY2_9EURO|nr:uncharacterized protein BO70DRAFT_364706 [Aspergillus heteromorphus CBS 117.55]PWY72924.1 hypothetical protein BO70DRAFT_364706 [Aspergillus heteromorphus CBS 117.55]
MHSMQRQFGRLMKRSADESQVAILLKDFEEADKLLGKIVDSTSAWRDAWSSILSHQNRMLAEFEGLYAPIVGSSDASAVDKAVPTPEATLARTNHLREQYEDLRKDLLGELAAVDERMIRPASQAREFMSPVKKTIKRRDDRKLDFERYQSRVDTYNKKTRRSDRDNAALVKAESDLERATAEYHAADERLRQCLPPLIAAVFSLLPQFLAAQIEIQNSMLAHYYTVVLNYCQDERFPSPPPPMDQVIQEWERACLPVQQELEEFSCIIHGRTVLMSEATDDQRSRTRSSSRPASSYRRSSSRPAQEPSFRRSSSSHAPPRRPISPIPAMPPNRLPIPPKPVFDTKPSPVYDTKPSPSPSYLSQPSNSYSPSPATPSSYKTAPSPSPALSSSIAARTDYFSRNQSQPTLSKSTSHSTLQQSPYQPTLIQAATTVASPSVSASSLIAASKKKPPPPPPPRAHSNAPGAVYVTAVYDFDGESAGDLAFREGDRIRVLKKTDSTDDWWEGEVRGRKGSFPANYVE